MKLTIYDKSFRYFTVFSTLKNGKPRRHTYMVYRDGTITSSKGKIMKRKLIIKTRRDGSRKVYTRVRLGRQYFSYNRVVYGAWNSDFDISNQDYIILPKDGNVYNHKEHNLYATLKPKLSEKVLNDEQVLEIRELYVKTDTSIRKLAKQYGVSIRVIQRVLNNTY